MDKKAFFKTLPLIIAITLVFLLTGCDEPPDPYTIAFAYSQGTPSIGFMDTAGNIGGQAVTLPHLTINSFQPLSWSPDGSRLAVAASDSQTQKSGIYLVKKDGSGLTEIAAAFNTQGWPGPSYRCPAWSPDGYTVAFLFSSTNSANLTTSKIVLFDVAGGGYTRVEHALFNHSYMYFLSWSPDGARLGFLFYYTTANSYQIGIWDAATNQVSVRALDPLSNSEGGLRWANGNDLIFIKANSAQGTGIYRAAADGAGAATAVTPVSARLFAQPSPFTDGNILFSEYTAAHRHQFGSVDPGGQNIAAVHAFAAGGPYGMNPEYLVRVSKPDLVAVSLSHGYRHEIPGDNNSPWLYFIKFAVKNRGNAATDKPCLVYIN